MNKLIMVMVLTLGCCGMAVAGVSADDINRAGFNKLSTSDQLEVIKLVESKKTDVPPPAVAGISPGTQIGQMLNGTAKELGVAVNEFIKTPVGKIALAMIVWKIAGAAMVHIIAGLMILVVGLGYAWTVIRTTRHIDKTYDSTKTDIFGRSVLTNEDIRPIDDGTQAAIAFIVVITILIFLLTTFTF